MKELPPKDRKIDMSKAYRQWLQLYNFMASQSLVYLLPSVLGLQDLVYVANLGIVLPHTKNQQVVLSNFKSEPRRKEAKIGDKFFDLLQVPYVQAPQYFEGEADLKYLRDNIYIGAYGARTSENCLNWFERTYDMKIIRIESNDPKLYHLDCLVFPLDNKTTILSVESIDKKTLKEIEKVTEVVPIPLDVAHWGATNNVRLGRSILIDSDILDKKVGDDDYVDTRNKVETLTKICSKYRFEPVLFNLSEFAKSGANLSCMVMHLNYADYLPGH